MPPARVLASDGATLLRWLCAAQGKRIFRAALDDGSLEGFFPLVQHFQTQSEPASCALGTLCMARRLPCWREGAALTRRALAQVLNALGVDPGLSWKGPWRWWSEEARALDTVGCAC